MTRAGVRAALYLALAALYLLHLDWWQWDDPRRVLGLPVGLGYHVAYCLAAAALLGLLVRFAWPLAPSPAAEDTAKR